MDIRTCTCAGLSDTYDQHRKSRLCHDPVRANIPVYKLAIVHICQALGLTRGHNLQADCTCADFTGFSDVVSGFRRQCNVQHLVLKTISLIAFFVQA